MHVEDSPFILNMKPYTYLIALFLLCSPMFIKAQGVDDALINSQTYYEGTARSMAMGNATGALGGDVTAACINPAGLGLYRTSEFTFSTGLQHNLVHSTYYGTSENVGKMRMSIPNFGFVATTEFSNYKPLRYMQYGISLTHTNDFNYRTSAKGMNPNSSMVDAYLQTINGIDELFNPNVDPGNFFHEYYAYSLSPAWETFLIDQFTDSTGGYFYDSPIPQGDVWQSDAMISKGRTEEWTFSLSANFYDKLFIGTSLGLVHLKRIYTHDYQETPASANANFFNWTYQEELSNSAWGANLKLGIIYFPASWLRFGAAWHSRTLFTFEENWSTETSSTLKDSFGSQDYHKYLSPDLYQGYEFYAPRSFTGSLAFFIGSHGMISADLDYLNYGNAKFSSEDYSFSDANQDIRDILKPTCNIRLGAEWRWHQYFLRGGGAYYGSPYGFGENYGSVKKLALGIGYATEENIFWDFAYELAEATSGYTPYQYYEDGQNLVNDIVLRRWRNKFVITLKVKME